MTRTLLMLGSLSTLLVVTLAILISLSDGLRRHRVGVTLLASWASIGVSIYVLRALGDPLPVDMYFPWYGPLGTVLAAWAMWDVSRLARHYGTTTLAQAADIARGFLHSPGVDRAVWATWARHLPTAAWVKGANGCMVAINAHYERTYGKPAAEYVGGSDGNEWHESTAAEYAANDRQVFALGAPMIVREPTPTWDNPSGNGLILKFPLRDSRGTIVGIGGIELVSHPSAHVEDEHEDGGP